MKTTIAIGLPKGGPSMDGGGSSSMSDNEVCLPLDSLSLPDDKEQMEPPAVGDLVQANIEGKVSRVEGGNAYVTMSAVNGTPIEGEAETPHEDQTEGGDESDDSMGGLERHGEQYGFAARRLLDEG